MNTKITGRKATSKTPATRHPSKAPAARKAAIKKAAAPRPAPVRKLVGKRKAKAPTVVAATTSPASIEPVRISKQARLIALLRAQPGATIEQMTKLTGWQPHTVRGTISGVLRKRLGLNVACAMGEAGTRVYRIVGAAASA